MPTMARQRRFPPWFSLLIAEVKNEEAFRVPDVSGNAGLSLSSESHFRLMNPLNLGAVIMGPPLSNQCAHTLNKKYIRQVPNGLLFRITYGYCGYSFQEFVRTTKPEPGTPPREAA